MLALLKFNVWRNDDCLLILLRQFGQRGHRARWHHACAIQRPRLQNSTARAAVNPRLRIQNEWLTARLG
jgi:hypothetical protein